MLAFPSFPSFEIYISPSGEKVIPSGCFVHMRSSHYTFDTTICIQDHQFLSYRRKQIQLSLSGMNRKVQTVQKTVLLIMCWWCKYVCPGGIFFFFFMEPIHHCIRIHFINRWRIQCFCLKLKKNRSLSYASPPPFAGLPLQAINSLWLDSSKHNPSQLLCLLRKSLVCGSQLWIQAWLLYFEDVTIAAQHI